MFDWTRLSDDPNHPPSVEQARQYLLSIRKVVPDMDLNTYVEQWVAGKKLLDVGVVSHSARYFDDPNWRHGKLAKAAGSILGVDILEDLIEQMKGMGYNVRTVDALSDTDLGDRFDLAYLGDIVEHVNDPVKLLKFGARHVKPGGDVLVTTPNPFSRKFIRRSEKKGLPLTNLDHLFWVTPSNAMELARRAGLELAEYHLVKYIPPNKRWASELEWKLRGTPEISFPDYLYVFRHVR